MRNGQNNNNNNNKRMRGRNNSGGGSSNYNNNNNNRRSQNPMTRVYESNGPDIKIRGTASHVAEKYLQLARDARTSSDPVAAENYYQHAEHYFRLIAAAQEQLRQNQPQGQQRPENETTEDGGDEGENFSNFGAEPGFVQQPQQQPQPQFQPRDQQQAYPREQNQPREFRDNNYRDNRDNRPQPQAQPQPSVQSAEGDDVERLPSFITGGAPQAQPQANNALEGNGGERFNNRRRRRPHNGPRPDGQAPAPQAQGEDFGSE